jgi:hypothetical protein
MGRCLRAKKLPFRCDGEVEQKDAMPAQIWRMFERSSGKWPAGGPCSDHQIEFSRSTEAPTKTMRKGGQVR